ncbi:hypothetical protein SB679_14140 [Chryseobacterium sp. SIMBA_029]
MIRFFISLRYILNDSKHAIQPGAALYILTKKYDRICVFIKARKPQWIVHPIVIYHDTVCGKAGLGKDNCRKAELHKIKNGMGLYNICNRGTGIPCNR